MFKINICDCLLIFLWFFFYWEMLVWVVLYLFWWWFILIVIIFGGIGFVCLRGFGCIWWDLWICIFMLWLLWIGILLLLSFLVFIGLLNVWWWLWFWLCGYRDCFGFFFYILGGGNICMSLFVFFVLWNGIWRRLGLLVIMLLLWYGVCVFYWVWLFFFIIEFLWW